MAHFAQLTETNVVVQVIVIRNDELLDDQGKESEQKGIEFCQALFPGTRWKQTSYNGKFRKNFASVGYTFDEARDAFIAPKPHESWVFDESICRWVAPKPHPDDGAQYYWNEETISWIPAAGAEEQTVEPGENDEPLEGGII